MTERRIDVFGAHVAPSATLPEAYTQVGLQTGAGAGEVLHSLVKEPSKKAGTAGELLVIDTGGTIGSAVDQGGRLFHDETSGATHAVHDVAKKLRIAVRILSLDELDPTWPSSIDSCEMQPGHWSALARHILAHEHEIGGVVVLHGTDTLAFTASALSFALAGVSVPIVLTGSQRSLQEAKSDALDNISLALEAASGRFGPLAGEVVVAFGGKLFRGNRSTKVSVLDPAGFASPALAAFEPGSCGEIPRAWEGSRASDLLRSSTCFEPRVWLVDLWPGLDNAALSRLVEAVQPKGMIFRVFGSGVAPSLANLPALARHLAEHRIPSLAISSVPGGRIDWQRYEGADALLNSDLVDGADMTSEAAVTKMMWILGAFDDFEEQRVHIHRNLAGELTRSPGEALGKA